MLNTTNYRIIVKYKSSSGADNHEIYFVKGSTVSAAKAKVAEIEELSLG